MQIKFVTEDLDSYTDYRRLIELSSFERVNVDQIIDDGSVYICAPATERLGHKYIELATPKGNKLSSKFIYWMLERPPLDANKIVGYWDFMFSEIWAHDAVFMATENPKVQLVRIGSDSRLKMEDSLDDYRAPKSFDFIHLCAPLGRRWHVLQHLPGITAPNAWGAVRALNLRSAKFMLNVHQDNYYYMEPLRIALAAAYQLPLLTEDLYPGNFAPGLLVQQPYCDILDTAIQWVNTGKATVEASRLYEKYCIDETFEKNVRKALA